MKKYLFRISLVRSSPEIWRTFVVPSNIDLSVFHVVIQIVMGWTDSHIFEFTIDKKKYSLDEEFGLDCNDYELKDLLKQNDCIQYVYDFGNFWQHNIVLEDSNYSDTKLRSEFVCIDGEMGAALENVGGIHGYTEFCEIMKNPKHPDYEEKLEWAGEDFNAELFNLQEINSQLLRL